MVTIPGCQPGYTGSSPVRTALVKIAMLEKVISGGQTGVDRIGLISARQLGIPTGGYAPKGFRTGKGYGEAELLKSFGMEETDSFGYALRTEMNVKAADFTVLFGDMTSPGSQLTLSLIAKHKKPYIVNPTIVELVEALKPVKILNVAGNRAGKLSNGEIVGIAIVLYRALKENKENG